MQSQPDRRVPPGTPRLLFREFAMPDLDALCRLDADPDVMRYVGDGAPRTRDEVAASLARIVALARDGGGLGVWHASRRDTGAFAGWFALKHPGDSPDVEVGYRLCRDAWGQGLATEGARAMLAHGFGTLAIARIIGVTHPQNAASQRVLLKIGMRDEGWGYYYGRYLRLFAAARPAAA